MQRNCNAMIEDFNFVSLFICDSSVGFLFNGMQWKRFVSVASDYLQFYLKCSRRTPVILYLLYSTFNTVALQNLAQQTRAFHLKSVIMLQQWRTFIWSKYYVKSIKWISLQNALHRSISHYPIVVVRRLHRLCNKMISFDFPRNYFS